MTGSWTSPPGDDMGRALTPTLEPHPPAVWPVVVIALALFPAMALASGIAVFAVIIAGENAAALSDFASIMELIAKPTNLMIMILAAQFVVLCAAVIPALMSRERPGRRLGLVRGKGHPLVWMLFALAMPTLLAPSLILVHVLIDLLRIDPGEITEALGLALQSPSPMQLILLVGFISIVPAFCEELLLRGYMQRRLLERWHPFWAIAFTTLVFSLLHMNPVQMIGTIPMGVWLGLLAWRTGTVWPCVLCHFTYNLAACIIPLLMQSEAGGIAGRLAVIAILSLAVCAFAGSIVALVLIKPPSTRWLKVELPPEPAGCFAREVTRITSP